MNEVLKSNIIENAVFAIRNTELKTYFSEEYVRDTLNCKIKSVNSFKRFNYEKTSFFDGTLSIDRRFYYESENEYKKIIMASYGLYCLVSDSKKYEPVIDYVASYFSSLAFRRNEYLYSKTLVGELCTFINHNIVGVHHILVLESLIGEKNIAYLFRNVNSKHSFYDNFLKVTRRMPNGISFNNNSVKKIEKSISKFSEDYNYLLRDGDRYLKLKEIYNKYIKIVNQFEDKYPYIIFDKFQNELQNNKFLIDKIKEKYDVCFYGLSNSDNILLSKLFDIFDTPMEMRPFDYSDFYNIFNCHLDIKKKYISNWSIRVRNEFSLINDIFINNLIVPLVKSNLISSKDLKNIGDIIDTNRKDEKAKTDIKSLNKIKQYCVK